MCHDGAKNKIADEVIVDCVTTVKNIAIHAPCLVFLIIC